MADCFGNIPLENIENCVNEETPSGVVETEVYVAFEKDITTDSEPTALGETGNTFTKVAEATTDIVFGTGKGFYKMQIQTETGEIKSSMVGSKGNKKFKSILDGLIPGTSSKNLGFLRQFKSAGLVVLAKEKSGRYIKLGSKNSPAYFESVETTTGKGPEDDNGSTISIENVQAYPAPVYTGAITEITPA